MEKGQFFSSHFLGYYNVVLAACFIVGSIVLIIFSEFKIGGAELRSTLPLIILIIFGLFCLFSAIKYLRHEKLGRVCLLLCCIIQVISSIFYIYTTYRVTSSVSIINIIMLFVGAYGTWYLSSRESKEWTRIR